MYSLYVLGAQDLEPNHPLSPLIIVSPDLFSIMSLGWSVNVRVAEFGPPAPLPALGYELQSAFVLVGDPVTQLLYLVSPPLSPFLLLPPVPHEPEPALGAWPYMSIERTFSASPASLHLPAAIYLDKLCNWVVQASCPVGLKEVPNAGDQAHEEDRAVRALDSDAED